VASARGGPISGSSAQSHEIREIENEWILLGDGTRLAARIWMPGDALEHPVPAVLEYLPYRKDDCTAHDDALRHPYFAAAGYAAVRVDLRGTGDSDGLLRGEYLEQEQDDALEVLEWLAEQPWCTGDVGMIGFSWGGFNGLQIAARRPPQLKAVITHASTDDRYLDDCHYMGGCMLASDMLKWSSSMLAYPLAPPDPRFVGERWREMWLHRLENAPELAHDWIAHQRRDEFWKHGSVSEDYSAIECPVFATGGWADAYTNAVPRLLENLSVPSLGLIGPWAHMMPHLGVPGPAIGFLQECVRWWDQWLKGNDTGIMDEPRLRAWMQDYVTPAPSYAERPGRWVGVEWPIQDQGVLEFVLDAGGGLMAGSGEEPAEQTWLTVAGEQRTGETAGVWCANGKGFEMAVDQRPDDERSLTFTSEALTEPVEVLGRPSLSLTLRVDKPLGVISARLEDVAPDGTSLLVCWEPLNLTHRDSHEDLELLAPGTPYDVELELGVCGHVFAEGHRIRLAISPTYWPNLWPSPEAVTLEVAADSRSRLGLPLLSETGPTPSFEPAESSPPLPDSDGRVERTRETAADPETGRHEMRDHQYEARTIASTGVRYSEEWSDTYAIVEGDPLSAAVMCERETRSESPELAWRVNVSASMTCDANDFIVTEAYSAHEGEDQIYAGTREYRIPRDHV
jgi:putative CocE/NonD family hydrolase